MVFIGNDDKRINWQAIHAEYISGSSLRKLADKYGVGRATIANHSVSEHWQRDREQANAKAIAESIQKTADMAAENAVIAAKIKRKLLLTIDRLSDRYLDAYNSTEHRDYKGVALTDITRLRDLTASLKDVTADMPTANTEQNAPIFDLIAKLDAEAGADVDAESESGNDV